MPLTYTVRIGDAEYRFDPSAPTDISIPLDFSGEQPNAFGLPRASAHAFESGSFVGDTRRGGSCNCETITLNPHGSGTHTECAGHVTVDRLAVADALQDVLVPAVVLTVTPAGAITGEPARHDQHLADDRVISRESIEGALMRLGGLPPEAYRSVILRTLPNDTGKRRVNHTGTNPPYVTVAAMHMLRELGVDHLVVDLPSVDREDDGGSLAAHRAFFGVSSSRSPRDERACLRTITELAYVPDDVADGVYLLALQVPPFVLDAAPSRPMLLRVVRAE